MTSISPASPASLASPPANGSIDVVGVDLAFPTRDRGVLPVLDGIDLRVAGGGIVALIGPNGCGKSTLLRVIAGLLAPQVGRVTLDGAAITAPDPGICLVFQEPRLLPWRSAADNITYPLELAGWSVERRRARLRELTDLVDLDPGVVGNRPAELSGGTRQRVALAHALALQPRVLLLDEPTAQLDPLGSREVFAAIRALSQTGMTVVLVEHKPELIAAFADRVIVIDAGRVVLDGVPQTILASSELQRIGVATARWTEAARLADAHGLWSRRDPLPVTLDQAAEGFRVAQNTPS